jgi:hemoglobin
MSQVTESKPLFERIGGDAAVNAAVDIFYKKVLADSLLAPFFSGIDMERQIKKQKQFLTYAFGGPNHYTGRGMRNAHKASVEKGLTDAHFDRVVSLLAQTLTELNVPASLINEVAAVAESTRADVLNR